MLGKPKIALLMWLLMSMLLLMSDLFFVFGSECAIHVQEPLPVGIRITTPPLKQYPGGASVLLLKLLLLLLQLPQLLQLQPPQVPHKIDYGFVLALALPLALLRHRAGPNPAEQKSAKNMSLSFLF